MRRSCAYCGKEFTTYPTFVEAGRGKYCSRQCSARARSKRQQRCCIKCGTPFTARNHQVSAGIGLYCSKRCWALTRTGAHSPAWKGGRVIRTCSHCGSEFDVSHSRRESKYCSHSCGVKSRQMRGPNNPNWKGGWTKEKSRLSQHKRRVLKGMSADRITPEQWDRIKRRFHYTCPSCGKSEPAISLTMDHIVPLSKYGAHSESNIQPLCKSCNCSKHTRIVQYDPDGMRIEVTDILALARGIVDGVVPLDAVNVNQRFLDSQARALKTELNYPGVVVEKDTTLASRSA